MPDKEPLIEALRTAVYDFDSLDSLNEYSGRIKDPASLIELTRNIQELTEECQSATYRALRSLASKEQNLILLSDSEIPTNLLRNDTDCGKDEKIALLKRLFEAGLSTIATRLLFQQLLSTDANAAVETEANSSLFDVAEHAIKHVLPPHYFFDTGKTGYASIEFGSLPRPFPPTQAGYTFFTWLRIDRYHSEMHVTLFGVLDQAQKSFTMVYIEKTTNCLILQTGTKSSVRFGYCFEPGIWYNIAICHKRPRATSSARASLYINGGCVETLRCAYPASAPAGSTVQGFIGTLRDFAPVEIASVEYSLGQTILVGQILSSELLQQYFHLGIEYVGNYQDYLASYMTYEASSELKALHDETPSADLKAKNSENMPESALILSIAGETFSTGSPSFALSREAKVHLAGLHKAEINQVVLNKAIPNISVGLTNGKAIGIISGDVIGVRPSALCSNIYKIGGVGTLLYLVARASTKSEILLRVKFCLNAISKSFINSEDFEKAHGYEILTKLLKETTPDNLCPELLALILEFNGIRNEILNNPMAYRFLLADFSLWSRASEDVQKDHLNQFLIFSNSTRYKTFNNTRMARMNIVKKFLHILRLGVAPCLLSHYITALKGLLVNNFSTEVVRSVSSFIIHMLHRKGIQRRYSIRVTGTDIENLASPSDKQNTGLAVLRMLEELLVDNKSSSNSLLDKFAYTITNRWTLLLLSHAQTRPYAIRILARLLISQGRSYINKFGGKNDGFVICEALLETSHDQLWTELLCIAFGTKGISYAEQQDVKELIYDGDMSALEVVTPEIIPVLMAILRKRSLALAEVDTRGTDPGKKYRRSSSMQSHTRTASLEAVMGDFVPTEPLSNAQLLAEAQQLRSVVLFLAQVYEASLRFRDFCSTENIAVYLIRILFCLVCDVVDVSPQQELQSKDSILTFDNETTLIEGVVSTGAVKARPPLTSLPTGGRSRASSLRRSSSFVLLDPVLPTKHIEKGLKPGLKSDETKSRALTIAKPLAEQLFEFLVRVSSQGVFTTSDLSVQDIRCMPPGFIEHHVYFWSIFQERLISSLREIFQRDHTVLTESRVLNNFAKFIQGLFLQMVDGIFVSNPQQVFSLIAEVLEYLRRPDISNVKSVKLCDPAIKSLRRTLEKLTLLRLCDAIEESSTNTPEAPPTQTLELLKHLLYYQELFFLEDPESLFLSLVIYHLYHLTSISIFDDIKILSVDVLRAIALLQKNDFLQIIGKAKLINMQPLLDGWAQILESDSHTFMLWLDATRETFWPNFNEALEGQWTSFTVSENKATTERQNERVKRRREHLKARISKINARNETIAKYEASSSKWADNVVRVESARNHKAQQDDADNLDYIAAEWSKLRNSVTATTSTFEQSSDLHWRLDPTECALRQRRKLRPMTAALVIGGKSQITPQHSKKDELANTSQTAPVDHEFEIVEQPHPQQTLSDELEEDKNRKVLRSLEIGDAVLEVYNISRISGLSAIEGLLILGRHKIYLIDGYFNRKDNEICDVWDSSVQAERDPILQVIAGQNTARPNEIQDSIHGDKVAHECRSFSYEAVTSASKRQFLFRDVAIEIFFQDGRNYLITTLNKERDTIHRRLVERTRLGLKDELSQKDTVATLSSFGAKLFNVFTNSPAAQATARWERRDITNFEYLMIINGLAGRSFNDLTQYPVMPWVLADYTSEVLDLRNPTSFRDLSRNMGSQFPARRKDFQERYDSFAGAGIEEIKPFHFGTHHSSAMVVCSYLIRLVPFVESYLLLQGGHFDHPDRLFHSVKKAWLSASKENMTDVRELTPEWFFLPEFLRNDNKFDFGTLQSTGEKLNHVELPPWAHGDPHIFIEKHREALESDYVSTHLHQWIDLIFGYKQLGQAAIDATNVYHSLSYHGAIDLDAISDPVQRLATIGIIHNFGQTPRQVFQRPHAVRDPTTPSTALETQLAQLSLQSNSLDLKHPVASISIQAGISGNSFARVRLANYPELSAFWANTDNSLRIIAPDGTSLGIFPSLHTQPITHCVSVSNFLVMGSEDTTLSTLKLGPYKNNVLSIEGQTYLRGHSSAISSLAVSATYSLILSGDTNGLVLVHDLNRDQLTRKLHQFQDNVCAVAISELSGYLVVCSARTINIFTVNGHLLATANLNENQEPIMTASVSASGAILYTGHSSGYSLVWSMKLATDQSTRDPNLPRWDLKIVRELQHATRASITAFKPLGTRLYTGDSNGKIYTWARLN